MTYDEFRDMATNQPVDERPSVFALYVFRFGYGAEPEYPEFNVDESVIYFSTCDEAKRRMLELVSDERAYCFQIWQLPLGVETERFDYSWLWLFDKSGKMIDHSYASAILADGSGYFNAPFRGRPEEAIRFKPGDIIEYLTGNGQVKIGIVLYTPTTIDELWQRMTKNRDESDISPDTMFMDYSDDIYIVIDEDYQQWGNDHNVDSTSALPLSLPLPDDKRERLIAKYEWAMQGN